MIEPDVLLVALSELSRDARTLNLARALAADGLCVAIHAADAGTDVTLKGAGEPLVIMPWNDPGGRAARRWWSLGRSARRLAVRPRLVIAMDLFALDAARAVAKRNGVPLLYDMREFYFALGPLQGRGLRQRLLAWHERRLLKSVDRVIVSGPLDADVVNERFTLAKPAVVVLNTPPYRDPVKSDLRKCCGVPHEAILAIYQGVVHHGRGLAPMFAAMTLNQHVHLAIVGNGPAEDDLRTTANDLGVSDRVYWCNSVPYDELHALTCGADVGVCLIEPLSMSYEYALPNKLFETMMARIPVLVTDLPALRRHIEAHPVGLIVGRALDANEIAGALDAVMSEPKRSQMIAACDDIRQLSYESQSARIIALCREHLA
ncbi:MAG: glycosyltransferase [Candidatus Kapaibacterium sp.]